MASPPGIISQNLSLHTCRCLHCQGWCVWVTSRTHKVVFSHTYVRSLYFPIGDQFAPYMFSSVWVPRTQRLVKHWSDGRRSKP